MNKTIQSISDNIDEAIENGYFFRGVLPNGKFINTGRINDETACIKSSSDLLNIAGCSGVAVMLELSAGLISLDFDTKDPIIKNKIKEYVDKTFGENQYIRIGSNEKLYQLWGYTESKTKFIKAKDLEIINKYNERKRVNALGLNKSTGKLLLWPRKKFWETTCDKMPVFTDKIINDLIEICGVSENKNNDSIEITPSKEMRSNHGSHNQLSKMLKAAVIASDSIETITENLLSYDEKINEKVSYFLCSSRPWKTTDRVYNCQEFIMEAQKRSLNIKEIDSLSLETTTITIGETLKFKEKKRASLPKLNGYGEELFNLCYQHSPIQRSRFSNLSVLMLISTLMGNKFVFNGIQANLFSMLITGQGGGKDFPLKFPRQVLKKIGHNELIGLANPASDLALMMNLTEQQTRIDTIDEATKIFRGMGGNTATSTSGMGDTLNELYSAPCDEYLGRTAGKYKDDKNKDGTIGKCFSPYINLIGATTTAGFQSTFKEDVFNSGLGSRFLYMFDDKIKRVRMIDTRFSLSKDLSDFLKSIRLAGKRFTVDVSNRPSFIEMKATNTAKSHLADFNELCFVIQNDTSKSQKEKSLYARALLQVQKIAMIDAVLTNGDFYTGLQGKNVKWAANWVLSAIKISKDNIELINSNSYEQGLNEVETAVKSYGTLGVSKTELGKSLRGNKNYKQDIQRLLDEGAILKIKKEHDAPNSTRFIHSSFLQK